MALQLWLRHISVIALIDDAVLIGRESSLLTVRRASDISRKYHVSKLEDFRGLFDSQRCLFSAQILSSEDASQKRVCSLVASPDIINTHNTNTLAQQLSNRRCLSPIAEDIEKKLLGRDGGEMA